MAVEQIFVSNVYMDVSTCNCVHSEFFNISFHDVQEAEELIVLEELILEMSLKLENGR